MRVPPNVERVKAIRGNMLDDAGTLGRIIPAALEALPTARQI